MLVLKTWIYGDVTEIHGGSTKKILHVVDEFHRVAGFMIVYEQTCTRLLFLLPARKW